MKQFLLSGSSTFHVTGKTKQFSILNVVIWE